MKSVQERLEEALAKLPGDQAGKIKAIKGTDEQRLMAAEALVFIGAAPLLEESAKVQEQLKEALAKLPESKRKKIQEAAWTDEVKLDMALAAVRTKKNNGVDDNRAPGQEQTRESAATLQLFEAAKKAFNLDDKAARIFAGMSPSDDELREAIKKGDSTVSLYDRLILECHDNIAKNQQ